MTRDFTWCKSSTAAACRKQGRWTNESNFALKYCFLITKYVAGCVRVLSKQRLALPATKGWETWFYFFCSRQNTIVELLGPESKCSCLPPCLKSRPYSIRGDWIVTDPFYGNFLSFGICLFQRKILLGRRCDFWLLQDGNGNIHFLKERWTL